MPPPHCKDGIPYSQFLRIRHICSDKDDFDKNALFIGKHLQRRGYPLEIIAKSAERAGNLIQSELLKPKPKTKLKNDNLFAITTYHPKQKPFQKILKENWDFLEKNNTTTKQL